MNKHHINIVLLIFILAFSSCATMFNAKTTFVKVITSRPSKMIFEGRTLNNTGTNKIIFVERKKEPLNVTVFDDSVSKTVDIASINSFAYWLNLYPNWHLWTGFMIDTKTKKRYGYPRTVYIDLAKNDDNYLTYKPLDKTYAKYSNILKLSPLKMFDLMNPSIDLTYERRTGKSLSTQFMVSYLLPNSPWDFGDNYKPGIKGFRVGVEEKYYFKKSANLGPYISFEVNYMKNKYRDIATFGPKKYTDSTYYSTQYNDSIGIKKQVYTFNFKYGYQFILKRLSIDFSAGIGLRYKDVVHTDRINPNDVMISPIDLNIRNVNNKNGKHLTAIFPLSVRIGWTF